MTRSVLLLARGAAHRLGMDRPVSYTFAARACNIIGSTGTVLLIVRFLGKVEQGYYYTLLSLVSIQIIFELGFGFVVQQLAAHEAAHLTLSPDGRVDGQPASRLRLAAILQKTARWYSLVAVIMAVTLLPTGIVFFHRNSQVAAGAVWFWPWICAAVACVVIFLLNPFCSFLEGCGEVQEVARMRLLQAILGAAASWASLLLHKGLYSPAAVIVAYIVAALWYLTGRRRLLRTLFRTAAPATALSWRTEVWGFQWKIALTFLSSYFTVQVLTPIIFASRGPVEAGRLGMSLSISGYLWSLVFTWMSTKATPFGQFVARRDFAGLDELFFRTFRRALAVIVAIAAVGMAVMLALQAIAPSIATRMVAPGSFGLLLLGAIGIFVVQCEAVYLRAHKEEPLMWQAVLVAVLTSCGAYVAAPRWGVSGIAWVYFLCSGAIGPILATLIFRQKRRSKSPDMELPELERLPLEAMP